MPLGFIASELAVPGSTAAGYSQLKHLESFLKPHLQTAGRKMCSADCRPWRRLGAGGGKGLREYIYVVHTTCIRTLMSDVEVCVCAYLELTKR